MWTNQKLISFLCTFLSVPFYSQKKADPNGWKFAFSSLSSPTGTQYSRQGYVLELTDAWQSDHLLTVVYFVNCR